LYLKSTHRITHSVDLASVTTTKLLNVIFDDRGEGGPVIDAVDPTRELRMPDEGVTTDELAIAGGPVDEGIGATKVEVTTARFNRIPLHGVLGCKLAELGADNSSVGSNVERVRIGASTPELLALGAEPGVKTSGRGGSSRCGHRGSGSRRSGGGGGANSGSGGGADACRRSRGRGRGRGRSCSRAAGGGSNLSTTAWEGR